MDLNPQPPANWTSAAGPYELADYCVENKTNILLLLNAWLDSNVWEDADLIAEESEDGDGEKREGERGEEVTGPDQDTLNYWAARLWPLWRKDVSRRGSTASQGGEIDAEEDRDGQEEENRRAHETIVVACNRTGEENGTLIVYILHLLCCTDLRAGSQARLLQVPQPCLECVLDRVARSSCIRWGDVRKVCKFGICLSNHVRFPSFPVKLNNNLVDCC